MYVVGMMCCKSATTMLAIVIVSIKQCRTIGLVLNICEETEQGNVRIYHKSVSWIEEVVV